MSEEKQTVEQNETEEQEIIEEQAADEQQEETNESELLQNQINELQGLLEEKENKLLRVQADFENYKRRPFRDGSVPKIPFSKYRD